MKKLANIFPVTCHTDYVGFNSTFVAIQGYKQDGAQYIAKAIQKGATKIVVGCNTSIPTDVQQLITQKNVALIFVNNTRKALAELSAQAAGYPAQNLKIIGITGTKGKTTSAFILFHVLQSAGYKTALLSTVKNIIGDIQYKAELTTHQPDYLHQFFKQCVEQNITHVVMEVAAQALTLHRVHGIKFAAALFTNFSQEHAEFYKNQEEYFAAKKELFYLVQPNGAIVINADDVHGKQLLQAFPKATSFGFQETAKIKQIQPIKIEVVHEQQKHTFMCPILLGTFNAYNVLGIIKLTLKLGLSIKQIQQALHTLTPIPGRLETYQLPNGATGIIDYAHNPASYKSVLSLLRTMTKQLIVIFGGGGERDQTKRPIMGNIASQYADIVLLTNDNPRTENPQNIIEQIKAGFDEKADCALVCELDREKAIKKAYKLSLSGAIIVLLGKGPDEYQIIGTTKTYFSEKSILQSLS